MPDMEDLGFSIITETGKSSQEISKLVNSLAKLQKTLTAIEQGGFEKFKNNMKSISSTLNSFYNKMSKMDAGNITGFTRMVNSIAKLNTKEIRGNLRALEKLPQIGEAFKTLDMEPTINKLERLAQVMDKFDKETVQAVAKLKNFSKETKKSKQETKDLGDKLKSTGNSFSKLGSALSKVNFLGSAYMARRVANVFFDLASLSIDMTENINLFGVAMGSATEKATKFINDLSRGFGLDSSELMKYMGVFMELNTAMGMAEDQAYTISENFTKLGLDIASLWNISEQEAFEKLQQGLAGLPKGLRQVGIDISENALSMTAAQEAEKAYALGNKKLGDALSESIENWDRVTKQQIIYLTIMRQTQDAQGDFARTLEYSVANKLKVLNSQFNLFKRQLGNIAYVIMDKALPPLIAMVRVLTDVASKIATLAGYELPSAGDAADRTKENFKDATGATDDYNTSLEKLNKTASLSIDELNTLGSTEGKDIGLGIEGLELPSYDNLLGNFEYSMDTLYEKYSGYFKQISEAIKPLFEEIKPLFEGEGKEVFKKLADGVIPELVYILKSIAPPLIDIFKAIIPVIAKLIDVLLPLVQPLTDVLISLVKVVGPLLEVIAPFVEKLAEMVSVILDVLKPVFEKLAEELKGIAEFFNKIASFFENTAKVIRGEKTLKDDNKLQEGLDVIGSFFKDKALPWLNDFFNSWIPYLGGGTPGFASGGFPTSGQLFWANENGIAPELVGTIGNRTAVVNNSQIIEGVSAGVARAVASVLSSSSGGQDINIKVELDGNVIYDNQQKIASRKGYQILKGGSFAR